MRGIMTSNVNESTFQSTKVSVDPLPLDGKKSMILHVFASNTRKEEEDALWHVPIFSRAKE